MPQSRWKVFVKALGSVEDFVVSKSGSPPTLRLDLQTILHAATRRFGRFALPIIMGTWKCWKQHNVKAPYQQSLVGHGASGWQRELKPPGAGVKSLLWAQVQRARIWPALRVSFSFDAQITSNNSILIRQSLKMRKRSECLTSWHDAKDDQTVLEKPVVDWSLTLGFGAAEHENKP